MREAGRLPAGQSLTLKWPVLHQGAVPTFDPTTWDFKAGGLVESPLELNWAGFLALPQTEVVADFHCVTRWSTFDNRWEGVAFREILKRARPRPEASDGPRPARPRALRLRHERPLADLDRDDVLFARRHDGQDLEPDHGGPLRLVVRTSTPERARSGRAGSSS